MIFLLYAKSYTVPTTLFPPIAMFTQTICSRCGNWTDVGNFCIRCGSRLVSYQPISQGQLALPYQSMIPTIQQGFSYPPTQMALQPYSPYGGYAALPSRMYLPQSPQTYLPQTSQTYMPQAPPPYIHLQTYNQRRYP